MLKGTADLILPKNIRYTEEVASNEQTLTSMPGQVFCFTEPRLLQFAIIDSDAIAKSNQITGMRPWKNHKSNVFQDWHVFCLKISEREKHQS
jgi:hypothetical protein